MLAKHVQHHAAMFRSIAKLQKVMMTCSALTVI